MKNLPYWKILIVFCTVGLLGCGALSRAFDCSSEEEEKLNKVAATQSDPRVMRTGLGAYAEGGDLCNFTESCIEDYVAMKAEFAKELKYWDLRFNGKLPYYAEDALRREGVSDKNIATTDRGMRLHSRDITKIYWCAWRNDPYFCKRFGLDASKRNIKRVLEKWEKPLEVSQDYEAIYGEKYGR